MGAENSPAIPMPARRRLRAFAFDPMSSRLTGRILSVDVPFERLEPGPLGSLVQVVDFDPVRKLWYQPVDLDDPAVLARGGLRPSESDPRTHQQVVYAISSSVIERFERFMGRRFRWRADRALRLVPHAFLGRNAYFDPERRAVLFGYYPADARDPGANLPGQLMFTCLSVDVVAHEVTHAIVDRVRKYFREPTNADVYAWHEAFADLVALFHHFLFREVVAEAIAGSHGDIGKGSAILDLAKEFGVSTGRGAALRAAISSEATPAAFQAATEPHERGACFVAGVFDAFLEVHKSSIADLKRLSSGGTGILPPGDLHPDLVARVTDEALKIADRFLGMVVRAFDYMPVVDPTFGDVLRAVVTADRALHPDDGMQMRAILVESLRRRGIYPSAVGSLTDEGLTWPGPSQPGLSLTRGPVQVELTGWILQATQNLDVRGHPGDVPQTDDPDQPVTGTPHDPRPAVAINAWARAHDLELGLDPGWPIELVGVHVTYQQASDHQPRPHLTIQLAQRRQDLEDQSQDPRTRTPVRAGTTVIARVDGTVEHVIAKPLPLSAEGPARGRTGARAAAVRLQHDAGTARLEAMRAWWDEIDRHDALAAWLTEPAVSRLSFASLHAAESAAAPEPTARTADGTGADHG